MNERAQEMKRLYLEEQLTLGEISQKFGVSRQRVAQIIGAMHTKAHYGRKRRHEEAERAWERIKAGETQEALAEERGVTPASFQKWLRLHGFFVSELTPPAPLHGTYYRYSRGCRCGKCRDAMRAYKRTAVERGPKEHGTVSAYRNYGCRCPACREAGSMDNRNNRIKRRQRGEPQDV